MKLNFDKPFIGLDEKEIPESNQGKTLAGALSASMDAKDGDVLKYWEWALKVNKGEVIDLDKADQKKLKDFIDKCQFNVLVKVQLLENFEEVAEATKNKK
jgi:hypothetical protein